MRLRELLGIPQIYSAFADIVGGRARETYAREYIRAQAGDRILDIGCGTGDVLEYLPANVTYAGFDASASYIESARMRFGDRGEFQCARVTSAVISGYSGFDIALANGVLHHLSDDEAVELFRVAHGALKPQGRLLTLDGCFVSGQSPIARFLIERDRGAFVRDGSAYIELARRVFSKVTAHIRHDLMRIPYTLIILECLP